MLKITTRRASFRSTFQSVLDEIDWRGPGVKRHFDFTSCASLLLLIVKASHLTSFLNLKCGVVYCML